MAEQELDEVEDDEASEGEESSGITRETELSDKEEFQDALGDIATAVENAYRDQIERVNASYDWWDIYNCELNQNQAYNGNSQAYVPLVKDAIEARKTRFVNQAFPVSGRYVEVISENGDLPHAEMALIEHYIDKAKVRTEIAPALSKNGDVEGQYSLYVSWSEITRHVISKQTNGGTEEVVSEEIPDAHPFVECVPDADIAIFPITCDSVEEAIYSGGGVSITRRWSLARIQQLMDKGEIVKEIGEGLLSAMKEVQEGRKDIKKDHAMAAGIKAKGDWLLAREVWHLLKVDGKDRLVRSYFGEGASMKLGTKLNPYWCDLCPLISVPVDKVSGSAKGVPPVRTVARLQYLANDFLNQAADSATYSLIPIVMTDPNKNPKTSTMILDLAAVWEVDPGSTQFAKFPELWKEGFELVGALKNQIQQSLGVNPSMVPSSSSKKTQADIANDQQVDLLTTADAVTTLEFVLTQMAIRFVAYDMQFRNDELLIPMYGMMGKRAMMERVPPLQFENRYQYRWLGIQAARNAAAIQQQIAMINVVKGIPPNLYPNHRLDLTAMIENLVQNAMGPRLAPLTFVSLKDELSMSQDEENKILEQGFDVPISPFDDDNEHLLKMQPLLNKGPEGDPTGAIRAHAQKHAAAIQTKQQAAAAQMMGQPQQPGSGPREGAQPGQPRMQQPPGAIHKDKMPQAGAIEPPRKASAA